MKGVLRCGSYHPRLSPRQLVGVSERGLGLGAVAGHALAVCTDQDGCVGGEVVVGWSRARSERPAATRSLKVIKKLCKKTR